jgi:hypothetical protein
MLGQMFFFSQRFHKILVATKHLSWLQTSQLAPKILIGWKHFRSNISKDQLKTKLKSFILLSDYFQVKLLLFRGFESLVPNKKMSKFVVFSIFIIIALTVGQIEALSIENQLQKIGTIKLTHK